MNENIFKRNEKLAKKVIEGLKSRNMTGYYASSKEEALRAGKRCDGYVATAKIEWED